MKNFLKETLLLVILSLLAPIVLFFLGGSGVFFLGYLGFLFLLMPYIIAHLVSSFLFWYKREKKSFFKLFFLRSLYLIALIFQLAFYKDLEISVGIIFTIVVFSSLTFNNFVFLALKKITEKNHEFFILFTMTSCNFFQLGLQ